MPFSPYPAGWAGSEDKTLNNSCLKGGIFNELIESKRKILWQSNVLLTVNNQYINDFMKKLIIYIKKLIMRIYTYREVWGSA
jgi:hypothetical protein